MLSLCTLISEQQVTINKDLREDLLKENEQLDAVHSKSVLEVKPRCGQVYRGAPLRGCTGVRLRFSEAVEED